MGAQAGHLSSLSPLDMAPLCAILPTTNTIFRASNARLYRQLSLKNGFMKSLEAFYSLNAFQNKLSK